MNGLILLPSLDRPELCKRFFESYRATETVTPGILIIDKNDPAKEKYLALELPEGFTLVQTEARTMGDKFRETWSHYENLDFAIILNDDHILRTKNWDQAVISQLNGSNCVFTNDGPEPSKPYVFPNRICGAIAISGKIYRALSWLFPPGVQHLFSDDAWAHLFSGAQCAIGMPDVCVEHRHAYLNPTEQDETFRLINGEKGLDPKTRMGTGGLWPEDEKAFREWLEKDSRKDIQKLVDIQPRMGLMIATPSHDGQVAIGYALGLADLGAFLTQQGIYFEIARVVGSSLIPHARNSLVDMFLKSKCQKLLFVDADQQWDKMAALRLFQSSRRIVAGVTPHKRFPINLNFDPLEKDQRFFKDLANKGIEEYFQFVAERADIAGEVEVSRSGTGFMMIDRSVFELMREHVEEYLPFDNNSTDKHSEYFKMGAEKESGRYRGEDWMFVELAKKLHIPIYIQTRSIVSHQGSHIWGQEILPQLEPVVQQIKAQKQKPELRPA